MKDNNNYLLTLFVGLDDWMIKEVKRVINKL